MATTSVVSNEGALTSASAVLLIVASNENYNQPALRIDQAGKGGGAASIKINDPNPDIEFVETDCTPPAGKYEIAVSPTYCKSTAATKATHHSKRSWCSSVSPPGATSDCEPQTSSEAARVSLESRTEHQRRL